LKENMGVSECKFHLHDYTGDNGTWCGCAERLPGESSGVVSATPPPREENLYGDNGPVIVRRECFPGQVGEIEAKVAKFNRTAERNGLDARATLTVLGSKAYRLSEMTWLEEWQREMMSRPDSDPLIEVMQIEVSGDPIRLPGGWEFVAVVDYAVEGRDYDSDQHTKPLNIIRGMGGDSLEGLPSEIRNGDAVCDHCGQARDRNHTIVVKDGEGEFKRVGSTCARVYLGISPAALLSLAENDPFADEEYGEWGGGEAFLTQDFVTAATTIVRRNGFTPSSAWDGSTRDGAWALIADRKLRLDRALLEASPTKDKDPRTDSEFAYDAMQWAKSYEGDDDFSLTLRGCAERAVVNSKTTGVLAYLPQAYAKHLHQEIERARKAVIPPSTWLGTPGEKTGPMSGYRVMRTNSFPGYAYNGPDRLLVVMQNETDGRVVKVWTTESTAFGRAMADAGRDDVFTIAGTVKEHDSYGGNEETVMKNVKALPE
jgi:hypothetical protein